ncbi:hypothetical protein [Microcystis aeruginosa]|nr:hypothetical protein [Microcystis aeruginosa]
MSPRRNPTTDLPQSQWHRLVKEQQKTIQELETMLCPLFTHDA